jgi:putative spermidine/putrescine transport system ATP-binding protein
VTRDNDGVDPFVHFDSVQKSYDGVTLVVKDLNLTIPKGEFLTMLGPSGSGKTTCLMMLAGFETATHGEIRLDGRPINHRTSAGSEWFFRITPSFRI